MQAACPYRSLKYDLQARKYTRIGSKIAGGHQLRSSSKGSSTPSAWSSSLPWACSIYSVTTERASSIWWHCFQVCECGARHPGISNFMGHMQRSTPLSFREPTFPPYQTLEFENPQEHRLLNSLYFIALHCSVHGRRAWRGPPHNPHYL